MKYKTLLIDLDDTLLDFSEASAHALSYLMSELAIEEKGDDLAFFEKVNRKCWDMLEAGLISKDELGEKRFSLFLRRYDPTLDAQRANRIFLDGISQSARLIPGAFDLCRTLSGCCRLALMTNGLADVRKRLEISGLAPFFSHLFISSEMGPAKPDPKFFSAVLNYLGQEAGSCLILGDSLSSDIKGGKNSGIDTCWYNPLGLDGTGYTYMIKELSEFIDIVLSH